MKFPISLLAVYFFETVRAAQGAPAFVPPAAVRSASSSSPASRLFARDGGDAAAPVAAPNGLNVDKFTDDLERFSLELAAPVVVPWKFRGVHDVHCYVRTAAAAAGNLPAVVLVHGLFLSSFCWGRTAEALSSAGHDVYALDLMGHGRSARPLEGVDYTTALWAEQVDAFCRDVVPGGDDLVLVGSSAGSLACLMAAAELPVRDRVKGVGMFICAGGLNARGAASRGASSGSSGLGGLVRAAFSPGGGGGPSPFKSSPVTFGGSGTLRRTLGGVATGTALRAALTVADGREEPASPRSWRSAAGEVADHILLAEDAGPSPMDLHAEHGEGSLSGLPVHVVWGENDSVTPLDGADGVARFYREESRRSGGRVTMDVVRGGHVPFYDLPRGKDSGNEANDAMLRWLREL